MTCRNRAQWMNVSGMNSAQIIARIGQPRISNKARRVDVLRVTGTRQNMRVAIAPYPVPVPSFSRHFTGYSLVSYDTAGNVQAAGSAFVLTELFGMSAADATGSKPAAGRGVDRDYQVPPTVGTCAGSLSTSASRRQPGRSPTRHDNCLEGAVPLT